MTSDDSRDPVLDVLTHLPAVEPGVARDNQIRSHCHAALARRVEQRARADRRRVAFTRLFDGTVAVSASLYLIAALVEAGRIAGGR